MSASRLAVLLCSVLLAGCDRPMGASDGVSPVAGMAPRHNVEVQTVFPGAGYRSTPTPGGEGQRAAGVIDRYQTGVPIAPPPETSETGDAATGDAEQ